MARFFAIALAIGLVLGLAPQRTAQARELVIGSINANPSDEMKDWLPFARYLAKHLEKDGITGGKVVVARDSKEMASFLKSGKVDLYIDSPLIATDVASASGSKLLLRRWKKGSSEYTSVVFARQDAGLRSLADLKGKVVAFEKESSSTGYLLPWLELQHAGLTVVPMGAGELAPPAGQVGYRFSGADRNTVAWVLFRRAAAGATSRNDFDKIDEDRRVQLTVIAETAPIPRHVVSYRGDLPPALVARIKDVLLAMDKADDGREVLSKFERTTKFDEIPKRSRDALARYEEAVRSARMTQ
jgi:phosphonate transport system substrate-binding protein